MTVNYFDEISEAIGKSKIEQWEIKNMTLIMLRNKLEQAKNVLKMAVDQEDHNNLKGSIENLEFQIKAKTRGINTDHKTFIVLTDEEINAALINYESDYEKASEEYSILWDSFRKLRKTSLEKAKEIFKRLKEIEEISKVTQEIKEHIPETYHSFLELPLKGGVDIVGQGLSSKVEIWITKQI